MQWWRQAAMTCGILINYKAGTNGIPSLQHVDCQKYSSKFLWKNSHMFGDNYEFNLLCLVPNAIMYIAQSTAVTLEKNFLSLFWCKSPRLISTNLLSGCWKWETNEPKSFQTSLCENSTQISSPVGRWMTGLHDNPFLWAGYVMVNASGAEL